MTRIELFCPECHQHIDIETNDIRESINCPFCTHTISVPAESNIHQDPSESPTKKKGSRIMEGIFSQKVLRSGADQARNLYNDLRQIPFKEEIIPINQTNLHLLSRNWIFWGVTLLGIIPLLIITVENKTVQLTMFALFFALVWGVIFKRFVLNDRSSWLGPVITLFFSGIIGIWLLLFIYRYFLPEFYLRMPDSSNQFISLLGFVFQVGVWEELFKALPLLLILWWKKDQFTPLNLITLGIFSGLGFAAFENMHYGERAISSAYSLTYNYGTEGLVTGVQNAMVITMLRAVSLVFCHAVWSGIVAYFVAVAVIRKEKVAALILVGIAVSASLHGIYDWLAGVQPTMAALIAGLSFALFYGYISKFESMNLLYAKEDEKA